MLCQKCGKNPATTHIKTVINGKVTEQNLCSHCASNNGYSNFAGGSISNMLASMLGQTMQAYPQSASARCQCCGASFADIAESGKVGCANCYNEFGNELLPYLKRIHGSVCHSGKVPGHKELVIASSDNSVEKLKAKLASLVAAEKYEEAALVRDEIKRLEAEE